MCVLFFLAQRGSYSYILFLCIVFFIIIIAIRTVRIKLLGHSEEAPC